MRVKFRDEASGSVGEAQRMYHDLASTVRAGAGLHAAVLPAARKGIPNLGCNTAQSRGERGFGASCGLLTNMS